MRRWATVLSFPIAPRRRKSAGSMRRISNTSCGHTRTQSRLASHRLWSTTGSRSMWPEYELSFASAHSHFRTAVTRPTPTPHAPRKTPQQERSRRTQAGLLDAAFRVLHEEGALGFTTTRVAEEAGVSVGSLYQYFPDKYALAVALHARAVEAGWHHVGSILDEPTWRPRRKVGEIARWFFAVESHEAAELGAVFDDLEVFL